MDSTQIVMLSGSRHRPRLRLDRPAQRLLHDEQHARLVGGRRRPAGAHLCAGDRRCDRGVAVAGGGGIVDLGKSIYLQPSFSAPVLFLGGLLFGYGMVLSNGCGSRALVLLGRGNLRSLVVVIVLASLRR